MPNKVETRSPQENKQSSELATDLREYVDAFKLGLTFNRQAWDKLPVWDKRAGEHLAIAVEKNSAALKNLSFKTRSKERTRTITPESTQDWAIMLEAAARCEVVAEGLADDPRYFATKFFLEQKSQDLLKEVENYLIDKVPFGVKARRGLLALSMLAFSLAACNRPIDNPNNTQPQVTEVAEVTEDEELDEADLPDEPEGWATAVPTVQEPTEVVEEPTEVANLGPTAPMELGEVSSVFQDMARDLLTDLQQVLGAEAEGYKIQQGWNGLLGNQSRVVLIAVKETNGITQVAWATKDGRFASYPSFAPGLDNRELYTDGYKVIQINGLAGVYFDGELAQLVALDSGEVLNKTTGQFDAIDSGAGGPDETPTEEPIPTKVEVAHEQWADEEGSWKITKLTETHNYKLETTADKTHLIFDEEVEGAVHTYQIEIKNVQSAENIRLLETEYAWPVIVAEVNGETMAYDPLNEAFLPMPENYENLYPTSERAIAILEQLDKIPTLAELKDTLDWSLVAKTGGHVEEVLEVDGENMYMLYWYVNLFSGGFSRLYFNGAMAGEQVTIGRFVYDADNEVDNGVEPESLLAVISGIKSNGAEYVPGRGWLGTVTSREKKIGHYFERMLIALVDILNPGKEATIEAWYMIELSKSQNLDWQNVNRIMTYQRLIPKIVKMIVAGLPY